MVIKKKKKLELEFKFYLKSSVRISITSMDDLFEFAGVNQKLYTSPDGFVIETGYVLSYTKSGLTLPTYIPYNEYDNSDLYAYYNFVHDMDRYDSLRRLYRYLDNLAQSRIFQYDNTGCVVTNGNKWVLY